MKKNDSGKKMLIVGDLMLDTYVHCSVDRISPEAPIPVLKYKSTTSVPGGAANVANNLVANGVEVTLVGMIGKDENGSRLLQMLQEKGIDTTLIVAADDRCTTAKIRYIAKGQQTFRLDQEDASDISSELEEECVKRIAETIEKFDLIVLSDYLKGFLTDSLTQTIIRLAKEAGKPVIVDPKSQNPGKYKGCTLIKPNEKEANAFFAGDCGLSLEEKACLLKQTVESQYVLVTLGSRGMLFLDEENQVHRMDSKAKEAYDVTGAGDTVLAFLAMGFEENILSAAAVETANLAAGVKVSKFGSSVVTYEELSSGNESEEKVITWRELQNRLLKWRAKKQRIVFTNGCFDLLHPGHVSYLRKAKALGDVLVLGLNSDASVRRLKGPNRPILNEQERSQIMAGLESVDAVVLFEEDTPIELIRLVKPDFLVKGGDYVVEEIVGYDVVKESGGEVCTLPFVSGESTTNIIEKIEKSLRQ